jgi:hypothetical protein
MSYKIWPSSDQAKYMHPKLLAKHGKAITEGLIAGNRSKWPSKRMLDYSFPFDILLIEESFFMAYAECTKAEISHCKACLSRYNRRYAVFFRVWEHRKPIPGIEIARLL